MTVSTDNDFRARQTDGWYICRACGSKLAKKIQGYLCISCKAENKTELEILCKHREKGAYCNTVNILEV